VTRHYSGTIPACLEGPRKVMKKAGCSLAITDFNQLHFFIKILGYSTIKIVIKMFYYHIKALNHKQHQLTA
jgi:hypothetical protein